MAIRNPVQHHTIPVPNGAKDNGTENENRSPNDSNFFFALRPPPHPHAPKLSAKLFQQLLQHLVRFPSIPVPRAPIDKCCLPSHHLSCVLCVRACAPRPRVCAVHCARDPRTHQQYGICGICVVSVWTERGVGLPSHFPTGPSTNLLGIRILGLRLEHLGLRPLASTC